MADSLIYSLASVCEHISLYRATDSKLNSNSSIVFLFFKAKMSKNGIFKVSVSTWSKTLLP